MQKESSKKSKTIRKYALKRKFDKGKEKID
jgi:hypothetical protein